MFLVELTLRNKVPSIELSAVEKKFPKDTCNYYRHANKGRAAALYCSNDDYSSP